jgi:hypothetical protein
VGIGGKFLFGQDRGRLRQAAASLVGSTPRAPPTSVRGICLATLLGTGAVEPCRAWFRQTGVFAYHGPTGERFEFPVDPYPKAADWRSARAWWDAVTRPIRIPTGAINRCAYDDHRVAMTGSACRCNAALVMGPAVATPVLTVPGLDHGHVVMYHRGGRARVLRLPDRVNPLHLVLASDGLTMLACCRRRVRCRLRPRRVAGVTRSPSPFSWRRGNA